MRRSYAYAGVSSRWSFSQVDRYMPAPRDYPTCPTDDLTASAIYGEAVQSNAHYAHDLSNGELRRQSASAHPQNPDPTCCIAEDACFRATNGREHAQHT